LLLVLLCTDNAVCYFRKDKFQDAEHMLMLAQAEKIRLLTEQVLLHINNFMLLFLCIPVDLHQLHFCCCYWTYFVFHFTNRMRTVLTPVFR